MVKFLVRLRRMLRRAIILLETLILRCVKEHRARIVQILHPLSVAILLITVGFFFIYELFYILPETYDATGWFYWLNWLLNMFLLFNVLGNLFYCGRTDTSFLALHRDRQHPLPTEAHLWHLCTHCQMLVPPRTWHCRLCNCCILKRDHHCNVTANCIGHANQRYFVALLVHLTLGSVIALMHNMLHLWWQRLNIDTSPIAFLTFNMSLLMKISEFEYDIDVTWLIIDICVIKLNAFVTLITGTHLILQLLMISRGSCMYSIRNRSYDLGFWLNVQQVLGKRMFWTLLSPLVHSELPHDGTQWQQPLDHEAKKPA